MKLVPALVFCLAVVAAVDARGQENATPESSDVHYFDPWPGVWHRVEGEITDSLPTFEVRRGPGHSFLEHWHLMIDGKRTSSFGLRSWDPASKSWRLVWVSDPDLFQIWDGVKLAEGWYITRQFGEGTDAFWSRQLWAFERPDRLLRTLERSTDGGKTWTVRSRSFYRRVSISDSARQPE